MPTALIVAGAAPRESEWAPISQVEFFTGLWTLRNPLRDAAVPYLYTKFYSASRIDSIWGGQNVELSPELTAGRRFGNSVYNSNSWPAVLTFEEFKIAGENTDNTIMVMVDTANAVYDGTGAPYNNQNEVFAKGFGAAQTGFVQVGNIMYMGDGVDLYQYLGSPQFSGYIWQANYMFPAAGYIVETNQNVQQNLGYATTLSNVAVSNNVVTITVADLSQIAVGALVSIYNMKVLTDLEAVVLQVSTVSAASGAGTFTAVFNYTNYGSTADTGYVCVQGVNGTTGSSQPTWNTAHRGYTYDGTSLWSNRGPSLRPWGIQQPQEQPIVNNVLSTSASLTWAANTYYMPQPYIVETVSSTPYIFQLTTNGTTKSTVPTFTSSGTVSDGSAVWTNVGAANRATSHTYALNSVIAVAWTKTTTVSTGVGTGTGQGPKSAPLADPTPIGRPALRAPVPTGFPTATVPTTNIALNTNIAPPTGIGTGGGTIVVKYSYTCFFLATTAGTSSATATASVGWSGAIGSKVSDGTVTWTNIGVTISRSTASAAPVVTSYTQTGGTIGNSQLVTNISTIIDSNGNVEDVTNSGESGTTAPTWATALAATTIDKQLTWINKGPGAGIGGTATTNTGAWQYCYAYVDSITGDIGPASPLSAPIIQQAGNHIEVTGSFTIDTHIDAINIYRTEQGQAVPFLIAQIFNVATLDVDPIGTPVKYRPFLQGSVVSTVAQPVFGARIGSWTYDDFSPDFGVTGSTMNNLISADLTGINSPPPDGFIPVAYHLGAIWGFVNNTIYYSAGPQQDNGFGGNEAFPPSSYIDFESECAMLWSTNFGLYTFLVDSLQLIAGSGAPFAVSEVASDIGLKTRNCFTLNGQTPFILTADEQVCIIDPNTGASTVGMPIGDAVATFNPAASYVTWHIYGTDQKLFVGDGSTGWYSMLGAMAPESGQAWDTKANIVSGISAIKSVETSPGVHQLLIGPSAGSVSPVTPELGVAIEYAILAYSGITNSGSTVVTGGTIGSYPTASITGFPPGLATIDNTNANAGLTAARAAYTHYSGQSFTSLSASSVDLSTVTGYGSGAGVFNAGNYSAGTSMDIPTSITLDAQGDVNAVWVFYAGSTVTLESGASILLVNGAQAANIVWLVGSSFTQIEGSPHGVMCGNILAQVSITLGGGTLNGRAFAGLGNSSGAVTIATALTLTATTGTSGGPILYRDVTSYQDNGNSYEANVIFGAAVLATHGELAELGFIAADLTKNTNTTVPTVSVLTDEIEGYTGAPAFTVLTNVVNDPPKLAASDSIWNRRWYFTPSGQPAFCRFMMLDFSWPATDSNDQLLSMTLYGRIHKERSRVG